MTLFGDWCTIIWNSYPGFFADTEFPGHIRIIHNFREEPHSMKVKRLFAGLLAAVITASAVLMSGCSGGNSEENSANTTSTRKIVTLNMYVITDEKTDLDNAREVQMDINHILLPQYKTMLKINYLTEDEYWDTLESVQKKVKHYREYGEVLAEETPADETAAADETQNTEAEEKPLTKDDFSDLINGTDGENADQTQTDNTADETDGETQPAEEQVLESDGSVKGTADMTFNELIDFIFDADDIDLANPQLDIFVVNDYQKYGELAANGDLAPMDEYLNYDSSKLKKYIYPTFLSAARVGKNTYGIPTNYALDSDFTYFVFNKDLLNKYGYSVSDLTTYANLGDYLSLIKNNEPGVWPVSGPCDISGAEVYEDSFLAIGRQLNVLGDSVLPTFMETKYVNNIKAIDSYRRNGYFPKEGTASENAKYAIEIVHSPELLEHEWSENGTNYEAYLYDVNRVSGDEAFKSAMVISSLSTNKDRAMEVITLFNTNAELANLLQYGISGENYYYDTEKGSVTMLNDKYTMNTLYTGNTYIKYPLAGQEDYVENARKGNIQTAPSAFLGFYPTFDDIEDKSTYEAVKTICKSAKQAIDDGRMDIDTAVLYAKRELVALGCVYVDTTNLGGIFGKVVSAQKAQAALTSANFALSDDILHYNDYYGLVLEEIEKPEDTASAEQTGTDGENTADGENADGAQNDANLPDDLPPAE